MRGKYLFPMLGHQSSLEFCETKLHFICISRSFVIVRRISDRSRLPFALSYAIESLLKDDRLTNSLQMASSRNKAPRKKHEVMFIDDATPSPRPRRVAVPDHFSQFIFKIPEKVKWRDIAAMFALAHSQERLDNAPGSDESSNAGIIRNRFSLCHPMRILSSIG
jgi:hypothetical protein